MNPINIAKGLVAKWDQVKDVDSKLADEIKGELAAMVDDVREAVSELRGLVDPPTIEREDGTHVPSAVADDIKATGRRLDEIVGGSSSGPKRNAKAAPAPNRAD